MRATEEAQCEVKERASCWWSPCENASVTENLLLPCHTVPEQSTLRGQRSSWWNRPNGSRSGSAPMAFSFYIYSIYIYFTDFIHVFTHWFIADGRMNSRQPVHSLPPAQRDYCTPSPPPLIVPQLFGFVCINSPHWWAGAKAKKTTKLLHNVADNYHDNMAWKEKQERTTETVQCHKSMRQVFSPPPWDAGH